eukprot:scaffold447_cov307-Pinguiococcus_pyrenoidosus.AAC.25
MRCRVSRRLSVVCRRAVLSVLSSTQVELLLLHHRREEPLEELSHILAALCRRLEVAKAVLARPAACLVRCDLPPAVVQVALVAAERGGHIVHPEALCFLEPLVQRLETLVIIHVKHQESALRVLVELVADLEEVWMATQVPKVHAHIGTRHCHRLHAIVDADGTDVLANEAPLAEALN